MAGPDIGEIYLETHADTKGLAGEIRRAAKLAGKQFGTEFTKGTDQSLSGLGNKIRAGINPRKIGKLTGEEFRNELVRVVNKSGRDFDIDIARAIDSGDWGPLFKNLDDVDAQMQRIDSRLTALRKNGGFKNLEVGAADARNQMREYVRTASDKTVEQQMNRNRKAMADMAREMSVGVKEVDKLAKAANFDESTRQLNRYGDAATDTRGKMRQLATQVRELSRSDVGGGLGKQIKDLSRQTDALETDFTRLGRTHRDSLVGMERDSVAYGKQVERNASQIRAFEQRVANLSKSAGTIKTKVELDTPPPAAVAAQGATLGKLFSTAFNKSMSKGGGAGAGKSFFAPLMREWNQFTYAFPAEVTILIRYFALIGSELGALGSGVGATLTGVISSLATAIGGLGAAAASTFPAMVYGIALASQSMKEFEKSFPATAKAVDRLKAAFTEVDVPAFAAQWEGAVRRFANTLAESLETDKIATALGKTASDVTNAFTGVISTPGWKGFVGAMETTIPAALTGIGTGFASLTNAALPFLTAAAPLAKALADDFAAWAGQLATTANSAAGMASIAGFMDRAKASIDVLLDLIGNLTVALGNVFAVGTESGNRMLGTLAVLAGQFRDFTASASGQSQLASWFAQGEQIFNALLPLLGAVGKMFAELVTPDTVAQTINFLNQLTALIPALTGIMGALAQLDLLGNLATLGNSVLSALQPILPAVTQIADAIGTTLATAFTSLGPVLTQAFTALQPVFAQLATFVPQLLGALGPVFAQLAAAVVPIATALSGALVPAFQALGPVVQLLAPVFAQLAGALGGVLVGAINAFAPVLQALVPTIAVLAGTLASALIPVLNALAPVFQTLAPVIGQLATVFAGVLVQAISALAPVIAQLLPVVAQLAGTLGSALMPIISALGPVFAQLAPIIGQIVTMFASTLMPIIAQLAPIIAQLVPVIGELAKAFMPIVETVLQVVAQLAGALMPVIQALIPIILQLAPAIVQLFIAFNPVLRIITLLVPVIMPLIQVIAQLVTWVLNLIAPLAPLINQIVVVVAQFLGFNKAITAVGQFIAALIPKVVSVINVFRNFGSGLGSGIKAITNFVTKGVQLFAKFVTTVVSNIAKFVTRITSSFTGLVSRVVATITNFVARMITFWVNMFARVVTTVGKGITNVVNFFVKLPGRIFSAIQSLVARMGTFWSNLFDTIVSRVRNGVDDIVKFFRDIPSNIVNALSGAGTALYNVGVDLVQGLLNGIGSLASTIGNWFLDRIPSWIRTPFKKALGISSPSKEFHGYGRNLMQGLIGGINADGRGVVKAMRGVAGNLSGVPLTLSTNNPLSGLASGVNTVRQAGAGSVANLTRAAESGERNTVIVEAGAIQVTPVTADPELTASAVLDRLVLALQ